MQQECKMRNFNMQQKWKKRIFNITIFSLPKK